MIKSVKLLTLTLLAALLLPSYGYCGEGSAGQPGEFLRWGVGARALGMGRAYSCITSGGDALVWNPAGLASTERWELSFMHSMLYVDSRYNFASFAYPTKKLGVFALGYTNLGMSDFDGRDEYNLPTGKFSLMKQAIYVGYGRYLWHKRLRVGFSTKFLLENMNNESASGWGGFDLGIITKDISGVRLALSVFNLGASEIQGEKIPIGIRTGLSYLLFKRLRLTSDIDIITGRSIFPRFGAEYKFSRSLRLRAGYDGNELSAGVGFAFDRFGKLDLKGKQTTVDYAVGLMNPAGNDYARVSFAVRGTEPEYFAELDTVSDPCTRLSDFELLLDKDWLTGARANLIFGYCSFRYQWLEAPFSANPSFSDACYYFSQAYQGKFGDNWKNELLTIPEAMSYFSQKTHYMYAESYMHKKGYTPETRQLIEDLIFVGGDSVQYDVRLQFDLAYTLYQLGELDSAKAIFKKIIADEDNTRERPCALFIMAEMLKDGSDEEKEEALEYLEKITSEYQMGFYNEELGRISYPMFPKKFKDNTIADDAQLMIAEIKHSFGGEKATREALAEYMKLYLLYPDLSVENLKQALEGAATCFEELGMPDMASRLREKASKI